MNLNNKKIVKRILKTFYVFCALLIVFLIYFIFAIIIKVPTIKDHSPEKVARLNPSPNFYTVGNNWLKKSDSGLWEMYVEGDGFERGVAAGKLTKELAEKQEIAFVDQIKKMIPSQGMLNYLKFDIITYTLIVLSSSVVSLLSMPQMC